MNVGGVVPGLWTCIVCKKRMHVNNRGAHLQGKLHINKAAAAASNSSVQRPVVLAQSAAAVGTQTLSTPSRPSRLPLFLLPPLLLQGQRTASQKSESFWTCVICNNRRMSVNSKEAHLAGKLHRTTLVRSQTRTSVSVNVGVSVNVSRVRSSGVPGGGSRGGSGRRGTRGGTSESGGSHRDTGTNPRGGRSYCSESGRGAGFSGGRGGGSGGGPGGDGRGGGSSGRRGRGRALGNGRVRSVDFGVGHDFIMARALAQRVGDW
ncbi:hypothetical protein L218DRAFT_577016 [Marasmius fiardii PR-910]|nr:hypothetical protein L218DRAFT_577016 [Marasmius fiardii PR-910]